MTASTTNVNRWPTPTDRWKEKSLQCTRDLRIKKIAITIICLINVAAIAALFVYLTLYCPLPDRAFFIAPFIGGVLAAMIFLKLPTGGLNSGNYRDLTNPALMLGKAVTIVLFGPTVIMRNYVDWTDYADPIEARNIEKELHTKGNFITMMNHYHKRVDNLHKYGFLSSEKVAKFMEIYTRHKETIYTYELLKRRNPKNADEFKNKLDCGEREWREFIDKVKLPTPEFVIPQFSAFERLSLWYSKITEGNK